MFFTSSSSAAIEDLQNSLSETLQIFFPLAGRYALLDNGALEIICNNAGAEFTVATSDTPLAEAFDFSSHSAEFEKLVPQKLVGFTSDITSVPLVLVQVTKFPCGGLSIVTGVHHNIADGVAAADFVLAWSQKARGQDHLISLPTFDRTLMLPSDPPSPKFPHAEFQRNFPNVPATSSAMRTHLFAFSAASINLLKSRSSSQDENFTNFELLAAHVWRSVTKARQLPAAATSSLGFAVEGRKQLQLQPGYFGNAIFNARAQASAGNLVQGSLVEAASAVRNAKQLVTPQYMKSALEWIEMLGSPVGVFPSFCDAESDFAITSWNRFPLYQVDFGFGTPSFVTVPLAAFSLCVAVFLPRRHESDDELNVLVGGLFAQDMERLLADAEFNISS